ncbi:MAG: SAM-dependent methyltransferase [Deltaproteobacteria bacterium SG8_13]|nr:MAG: SAM-dependent methyltransferase [Deltaproteobacteria bacterium SG8_13]
MKPTEWNPGKLLELSGHHWKTGTLHAGIKLGVFSTIGDKRLAGSQVARELECAERGMQRLLDALAAMGLLLKEDGRYANTAAGLAYLCRESPQYLGYIMMHHHQLVESWTRLDQAVSSGRPVRERGSGRGEQWRENFLMGMFNMAMTLAPRIVPQIDMSGRKHLLDLGGGPGTYAIHFCRSNTGLTATVFDFPTTRPFAEKTISGFDLSHRIAFRPGNFLEDDIGSGYDVAWLSHILHGEGPDGCRRILSKTVKALTGGGMVIIHEFILDDTMDRPLFPALFSLNMLLGTPSGQAYPEGQLRQMMKDAGLNQIRRVRFDSPNDSGILIGSK